MTRFADDDPEAMYRLAGELQESGQIAESEMWSRRAAEQGHVEAMTAVGRHLHVRGLTSQAEVWYRRAAGHGESFAAYQLAGMLRERGDRRGAIEFFRQVAAAGDKNAMIQVAHLLSHDAADAPLPDLREAERWFRAALADTTGMRGFSLLSALGGLIVVLRSQQRFDEAQPFMRKLEGLRQDPGIEW